MNSERDSDEWKRNDNYSETKLLSKTMLEISADTSKGLITPKYERILTIDDMKFHCKKIPLMTLY